MQIEILGPLSIHNNSVTAVPTARKPRKILAMLLLDDNRTVSASSMMSELWEENPPKSGVAVIQTYVLHLRQLFARVFGLTSAEIAKDLLQTRNGGYAFVVKDGDLDVHHYQRWQGAGDRALAARDDHAAVTAYRRALAQWQGPALLDVEQGPMMEAKVARLEQSRLTVTERKIDAELRLGWHRDTLSELAGLVLVHPFHEGLHAQFMLALYRSGNRNDALKVFNRLRSSLVSELGLDPAPRLQRLQHAILVAEPALDRPNSGMESMDGLRFTG